MKRVFMYLNVEISNHFSGVSQKCKSQIKTLRDMGYDITYTTYLSDGVAIYNNDDEIILKKQYKIQAKSFNHPLKRWALLSIVNEYMDKDIGWHFAYLRWHIFDNAYIKLLEKIRKKCGSIIVEAHTYSPNYIPSEKGIKGFLWQFMMNKERKNCHKIPSIVDLVAVIGGDYDYVWGVKAVEIYNAFDINDYEEHLYAGEKDELNLICALFESTSHGIPRILESMALYYKNGGDKNVFLHLVGQLRIETLALAEKLRLSDRVVFYGLKTREELDLIYNKCNIALASLAMYKHNVFAGGGGTKSKEYFAKGIPFIHTGSETLFDNSYPYIKSFPNDDSMIDIDDIFEFYDSIKDDKDAAKNMRNFSNENYTWKNNFKKILSELGGGENDTKKYIN